MAGAQILDTIWQNPGSYSGIAYSADGKLIAVSAGQTLEILNAGKGGKGEVVSSFTGPGEATYGMLAFSADNKSLAAAPGLFDIQIRDTSTLSTLRCSLSYGNVLSDLAFSPNGLSVLCATATISDPGSPFEKITTLLEVFNSSTGDRRCSGGAVAGDYPFHYQGPAPMPVVFSPSGQEVAYATAAHNGVLIVDAMTGAPVFIGPSQVTIPTPAAVNTLAFSPDGRWIVAGCVDDSLHVFDTVLGASPPNTKWPITLPGGAEGIESVAVSANSRWIAAINSNFLGIYALPDGTPRFTPALLNLPTRQLIYSPTLRHLIALGSQTPATLTVIDAFTGAVVATGATDQPIHDAALAPDGTTIACYTDEAVELLDLGTVLAAGVELTHYPNPANPIPYAADTALSWVAVSPTETPPLVAVADTSAAVRVINAQTGALVAGPKPVRGIINAVVFASQGQAVVTAASSGLYLFSIVDVGSQGWSQDAIGAVNALALVAAADGESLAIAVDKTAQLRTVATGNIVWSNTHPQTVTRIAASADGKWVATGCQDGITRILDAAKGAAIFSSPAGGGKVTSLAFAPSTTLLASANEDGTVLLVNATNPTQIGQLRRNFRCRLLAFSADATMLGVADDTNTVTVYAVTDLAAPAPLPHPPPFTSPVTALAFSPADSTLAVATGDTAVAVHDPRTGVAVQRIVHPQPVRQFAFNTTGTYLATICDDQTTRTWRMVFA